MGFCGWLFFLFPCHSRYWQFIPFYGHIILQRMNRPHFTNSSVNGQWFPQLGCCILLLWPFMWTFLPGECFLLSVIYLGVEQRSWQLCLPFLHVICIHGKPDYLLWKSNYMFVRRVRHSSVSIIFTCQLLSGDLCGWLLTQDWTGVFN